MAYNHTLDFEPHVRGLHSEECSICGRKHLGKGAVVAVFHPDEHPSFAAPYCAQCIKKLMSVSSKERK